MSIADKLQRLVEARNELEAALRGKGVKVSEGEGLCSLVKRLDEIGTGGFSIELECVTQYLYGEPITEVEE